MRKIDIHNYEAYLLDFSEGNLTSDLQVELELFLIHHPELEINLDELSLVTLDNEATSFSNKNALKKAPTDLISEAQFIAYIENQLPENERLHLEKSCAINATLSKELVLFTATLASPDASILFENKQSLKRKPKVVWFNFSLTQYAAAACVVFLIGVFMFWSKTNTNYETSVLANKSEAVISQSVATNNNPSTEQTTNTNNNIAPITPHVSGPQQNSKSKPEQAFLANNISKHNINSTKATDTTLNTIKNTPIIEPPKKETLIALNEIPAAKQKTVVQVITENDEEPITVNSNKKKKGIWAAASRALRNLNHFGVKSVNGDENENKGNTAYAITLGGVSVTHKAGL
jgi:hypothetical protein